MTLRSRITLLTLGILALSLLLIGSLVWGTLRFSLYRSLYSELKEQSLSAQRTYTSTLELRSLPLNVYARVFLLTATPVLKEPFDLREYSGWDSSDILGDAPLSPTANEMRRLIQAPAEYFSRKMIPATNDKSNPLVFFVRRYSSVVDIKSSEIAPFDAELIVMVGKSTKPIETSLATFAQIYSLVSFVILGLAGWLASRLVQRSLVPLEWIARKAEQIGDRPTVLPEVIGNNEITSLVRSLNRMMTRLDSSRETQSRFLLDASHELRTPVTAILGHISYLLRRTQVTEQQRESLEIVKRESERMQKLVGDLLDLSKSGNWKSDLGPVHLKTSFEEIQEEYRNSFSPSTTSTFDGSKGSILVDCDDTTWALGDPDRLHQVFANLTSNAIKAGALNIKLRATELAEKIIVSIQDDGEGIPPDSIPRLFDRFYRVDTARDRERGGSGLGLAIVKSIIEAHGGTIWIESELGRGSTFSLSLKKAKPPEV